VHIQKGHVVASLQFFDVYVDLSIIALLQGNIDTEASKISLLNSPDNFYPPPIIPWVDLLLSKNECWSTHSRVMRCTSLAPLKLANRCVVAAFLPRR
jgi:hypothetical protein